MDQLKSKKFRAMLLGLVVTLLVGLGVEQEIAIPLAGLVAAVVSVYVHAQGQADKGKEAAKVVANGNGKPDVPSVANGEPPAPPPGSRKAMGLTLLLAAAFLAGCVPAQAILQTRQNVAINRAHETDTALPTEAREIAQDNADAWEAQRYLLTGERLSGAAQERHDARATGS